MIETVIWLTDVHLNFLSPEKRHGFIEDLKRESPECVLIGGDVGEADTAPGYLVELEQAIQRPIYFVLGNHDFYKGSIVGGRSRIVSVCEASHNLTWMNEAGVVSLSARTALVGHDSWADGRLGDYWGSHVELNDFYLIEEFVGLDRSGRLEMMRQLAAQAAAHFERVLPEALESHDEVIVLTHVPPFRDATRYDGRVSGDDYLPLFSCGAVGDVLRVMAGKRPDRHIRVLCGHTHAPADENILPNLRVVAGKAEYGKPRVERLRLPLRAS